MHKEVRIEEFLVAYLSKKEPVTLGNRLTDLHDIVAKILDTNKL